MAAVRGQARALQGLDCKNRLVCSSSSEPSMGRPLLMLACVSLDGTGPMGAAWPKGEARQESLPPGSSVPWLGIAHLLHSLLYEYLNSLCFLAKEMYPSVGTDIYGSLVSITRGWSGLWHSRVPVCPDVL